MPLSAVYRSRSVYHFTPIANLPAILEHGLLAIAEQKRLGLPRHTIVWEAIQAHRASLAAPVGAGEAGNSAPPAALANPLSVEENEKRLLREALVKSRGNRTRAAEFMGISRRTLHRKLAQWPELDVTDR